MTNDDIWNAARQVNKVHIEDEVFKEFCMAFARVIERRTLKHAADIGEVNLHQLLRKTDTPTS